MLNIGPQELLLVLVIALVVVGPRHLPELGRAIGRGLSEFRKIQDEVRDMVSFDLGGDPASSTPRLDVPSEAEPEPEPEDDPETDATQEDGPAPMTHSERVVMLTQDQGDAQKEPSPASESPRETDEGSADPAWTYDVDDDEPVVKDPPAASAE